MRNMVLVCGDGVGSVLETDVKPGGLHTTRRFILQLCEKLMSFSEFCRQVLPALFHTYYILLSSVRGRFSQTSTPSITMYYKLNIYL